MKSKVLSKARNKYFENVYVRTYYCCGVYLSAAFTRGRRLMVFLLVYAAFIRVQRFFEGGVYSSNYGMLINKIRESVFTRKIKFPVG